MDFRSEGRVAVWEEKGVDGVHLRDRPETEPAEGMVAIRMRRVALNHLDLWTVNGFQGVEPPLVICSDGAGVVERSSDGGWKAGDEVVVYPVRCCWHCEHCLSGNQVLCERFGILGEHVDGTACALYHVPARNVYRRPASLSWEESAAFPLTFLTAWRMLTTRARLQRGETLVVVGAGAGVATAAVAIGKHLGARIFATSRSQEKRERAKQLGAEETFDSTGFAKAVRQATDGRGADVVFEHVGPATFDESQRSLAAGGRIVTCGATSGPTVEVNVPRLFFRQAEVLGSTMGNAPEFEALLRAFDEGMRPTVDTVFPLAEVHRALEHLDRSEQFGKVVLALD